MRRERIKLGDVFWVNLKGDENSHVQNGWHPAIVVQNNKGNYYSDTVVVVPITSKKKAALPTHVKLPWNDIGLCRPSTAQCEGQRPVSKEDFGDYIGCVDYNTMKKIAIGCLVNTPYQEFFTKEELLELKRNGKIC